MAQKTALIECSLLLLLALGCQEGQKAPKETLAPTAKEQIVSTPDENNTRMEFMVDDEDILTARNPGSQQPIYLTVVDKDGKSKECCKQPMRVMVDKSGRLALKCPKCKKVKPISVKDGKITAE